MFGFTLAGLDIKETGVDDIEEPEGGPPAPTSNSRRNSAWKSSCDHSAGGGSIENSNS